MASLSKVAQEILEKFDDDIASLVASGKTAEAATKRAERAKLYKQFQGSADEISAGPMGGVEPSTTEPKTLAEAISLNTEEFQRPAMGSDMFNSQTDLSAAAGRSVPSPVEAPTPASVEGQGPVTLLDRLSANKGKVGLGLAGAGAAGAALMSGPDAPPAPSSTTVTETEPGIAPTARAGAGSSLAASVKGRDIPDRMFRSPGSVENFMGRLSRVTADPIDGSFADEVAAGGRDKAGAELRREDERNTNDMGQLFDILGRSLVQIGAAQQGMRSGTDMSGIAQKSAIDWEARRKEISQDYDRRIAEADKRIDRATRGAERAEAKAEGNALERRKILTEDYFSKWKAYRDEILQSQRLANEIEKKIAAKDEKSANAGLKAVQQKLAKEEKRQTGRRLLDTQIDSLKAAQGTSDWDKELAKTRELFAKLNTDVEAGDRAFAPALPDGFWENMTGEKSLPDVDALKQYNRGQIKLGEGLVNQYHSILGSGQLTGEVTTGAAPETGMTGQGGSVTVQLSNGQRGEIPAANLDAFLRANPGSKRVN